MAALEPRPAGLPHLAHLRNSHPYVQLAAGFDIGATTANRYITEAVDLLAALALTLAETAQTASTKAFVLLDGTLLPIDRIAADRPFYSGKHKRHGMMNVQILTVALEPGLPRNRQLRDQDAEMTPRDPRKQPMRQHRPIDHDRHSRIKTSVRQDASPAITHQRVRSPRAAFRFLSPLRVGWRALRSHPASCPPAIRSSTRPGIG